jgi:hypothetical protein
VVVPAAPPHGAPAATLVVTPVVRPAPVVEAPITLTPPTAAVSPAPAIAPRPSEPAGGTPAWLWALFGIVDLAAAVALAILIRRTAAAQSSA